MLKGNLTKNPSGKRDAGKISQSEVGEYHKDEKLNWGSQNRQSKGMLEKNLRERRFRRVGLHHSGRNGVTKGGKGEHGGRQKKNSDVLFDNVGVRWFASVKNASGYWVQKKRNGLGTKRGFRKNCRRNIKQEVGGWNANKTVDT